MIKKSIKKNLIVGATNNSSNYENMCAAVGVDNSGMEMQSYHNAG